MTDEDESTDPGMIGAERAILKFLRVREANEEPLPPMKAPGKTAERPTSTN